MIREIRNELQIAGSNLFIISASFAGILIVLALLAGELLDLSGIGFEVLFPFFAVIAVGEWGKTRADDNYDVIAAQSKSLFKWMAIRYIAVMGAVSTFAIVGMAAVSFIRNEMPVWELLLTYFPTAFFLSSIGAWIGAYVPQEHVATLSCGVMWLVVLMARSLLQFPGVEYFYLFIRYAGDPNGIWLINKIILCAVGSAIWGAIYLTCKRRKTLEKSY